MLLTNKNLKGKITCKRHSIKTTFISEKNEFDAWEPIWDFVGLQIMSPKWSHWWKVKKCWLYSFPVIFPKFEVECIAFRRNVWVHLMDGCFVSWPQVERGVNTYPQHSTVFAVCGRWSERGMQCMLVNIFACRAVWLMTSRAEQPG